MYIYVSIYMYLYVYICKYVIMKTICPPSLPVTTTMTS